MEQSDRYFELARQGRETFLRQAAPAALVRRIDESNAMPERHEDEPTSILRIPDDLDLPVGTDAAMMGLLVYPLAKKPGAAFSDMITVGRTGNNDVVLNDVTVSRFHAYFKPGKQRWIVSDQGSKNGTKLAGAKLDARKEIALGAGDVVKFGDVEATFYTSAELYDVLVASV